MEPALLDAVRSELDGTMRPANQESRAAKQCENVRDLRTAAFAMGVERIAVTYMDMEA